MSKLDPASAWIDNGFKVIFCAYYCSTYTSSASGNNGLGEIILYCYFWYFTKY
jgi:hypothetical protein